MRWIAYLALMLLVACSDSPSSLRWEEIQDRTGASLYQVAVPIDWKRIDPTGPIDDSRVPNVTFKFEEVTLVVHTFAHQIPPEAQVERWTRQVAGGKITSAAFGGFVGLRFEAEGVIAWAMELPSPNRLTNVGVYTIKATGDVTSHRQAIDRFARSFGLIQEIP